jgi:hypothetical protein
MKHIFFALTNPTAGHEAAFNTWYDTYHVREVVQYGDGMRGGQRFRSTERQRSEADTPPWKYLAWYDLEHDDLAAYHRAPWIPNRPALASFQGLIEDNHAAWIYSPIGDPVGNPTILKGEQCDRKRFLFLAFTNAGKGQDQPFNDWYDRHHLPEIVATLPGFVAGRRYRLAEHQRTTPQPAPTWRYLAIYEVVANDDAAVQTAAAAVGTLTRSPSGALDPTHVAWVFRPIGDYYKRV